MKSHKIDLEVIGEGVQIAEITLDPGETVIAEAGAMVYMEEGIVFQSSMEDGSKPSQGVMDKIFSAGKRIITGESLFFSHFTNNSTRRRVVAFAGNIPGSIVGIDLSAAGGGITCQRDSFMCAAKGTEVTVTFVKKLGAGFFGGEGFILQRVNGDGKLVLMVSGKVIEKQLNNEQLRVDTGSIVAFTDGISYDIAPAGDPVSMLFGGHGVFLATLTGTGTVLLQSCSASKMSQTIMRNYPVASSVTGNTAIGNIGGLLKRL